MYCRPVVGVGTLSSRCAIIAPSLLPSQYGRGLTVPSSRANRRSTTCASVSVAVALYVHTWGDTQINIIFARPPLPPECDVFITLYFETTIATATGKVVSYSVIYWYMCRLDGGRCHRVVNKESLFATSSWFLSMPASLQCLLLASSPLGVRLNCTSFAPVFEINQAFETPNSIHLA